MEIKDLYQRYLTSGSVSTDSRNITRGSVFFALHGPNFNANQFASEALDKGASLAVVDDKKIANDPRIVVVPDALVALQQLAAHHRAQLIIPVIGLTGSNGKTTSKELLHAVLSKKYKTFATPGNLNNHIGVPLSILSVNKSHEIAIIEMGANHVGEIAALCELTKPTHGFITNIGKAHIGTFGSFENIVRGKSELYHYLIQHNGVPFINSQNLILANMAKRFEAPLFYPDKDDFFHAKLTKADPYITYQDDKGNLIQTKLMGTYNFENIAVALCIGKYFQVELKAANEAIRTYLPSNMRTEVQQKGTNLIILDAYNANPSSMEAAIENIKTISAKNKIAILGDMYELDAESEKEHRKLAELIGDARLTSVYLCGQLMKWTADALPHAKYFETKEYLIDDLKKNPITNATILIKASRGMGLEKIVDYL